MSIIYVIGDRDTVLGMRLVGGEGEVVRTPEEAEKALDRALTRPGVKLLLVTRDWAKQMQGRMNRLKMTRLEPVVMEIPGKAAEAPEETLDDLVKRAVGIRI